LDEILHPILDPKAEKNAEVVAKGLPAGPGGAVGKIVFTAEDAVAAQQRGEKVILVREETNPEDVEGMRAADGLLTARGGMTSHAALVARGWAKCCIVGCDALHIIMNGAERALKIGDKTYKEGDVFSLNGSKGLVYDTAIETMDASENERFIEYMNIVDKYRVLGVRTNAENPQDAQNAINMGAEGIGLFRIEHMFYGANSEQPLAKLRKMILSSNTEERVAALDELRPFVIEAVRETMRVMDGKSVTFRLLDPPLHEFVPHTAEKQQELADEFGISVEDVRKRGESLQETNPMMGHRGVRLGISFPEISKMQFNAIFTATAQLLKEGLNPRPEIMVPVTVSVNELDFQKRLCEEVRAEVEKAEGVKIDYLYGTMIEIPRAAITADQMAKTAQFFSFGTNDLTQMTFGFSRDDIGGFMKDYLDNKILPGDPFQTIDRESVGALIETGVTKGRSTNENLKIGICGEHGGDPDSVEFCHLIGMNYVSCSPFRVPIARLAAAQAAIRFPKK
jgi:pyruvate,orthophosphate dikinase